VGQSLVAVATVANPVRTRDNSGAEKPTASAVSPPVLKNRPRRIVSQPTTALDLPPTPINSREVANMKLVMAGSLPNEFAAEFTHLIRRFDESHGGCTFQIMANAALPSDLRPIFERLGFPVVDPRKFDRDAD